jgi:hypothetical protein
MPRQVEIIIDRRSEQFYFVGNEEEEVKISEYDASKKR